jgi:uncharacterized membrane protein YoaK (UPF0700 family)
MRGMAATAECTPATSALRWQQQIAFLVTITAAAAWLDVLAFLHLGKVFLSFMTGNLLFLGIATGEADGALLARAALALAAFLAGTALGARLTGSHLVPGDAGRRVRPALRIEAALLAAFAIVWAAAGRPEDDTAVALVLIAGGAGAMGVQAAVALALRLPNIATVAMTGTLAQLGALAGWRRREGREIVAATPSLRLMLFLCLGYLVTALVVTTIGEPQVLVFGPVVLIGAALLQLGRSTG